MLYFAVAVLGFAAGGFCTFIGLDSKRRKVNALQQESETQKTQVQAAASALREREQKLVEEVKRRKEHLEEQLKQAQAELKRRDEAALMRANQRSQALEEAEGKLASAQAAFDATIISYAELEGENSLLKRDMANLAIAVRKAQLDGQVVKQQQATIDSKVNDLGARYLGDHVKWIGKAINANNYASCKQRLLEVIQRCRDIGFEITAMEEERYLADLRAEYEREVRAALEREEQARIKAQIREEQQREREVQRELDKIERERSILAAALAKALAETQDQHSAEIESLKARLADAESKQRAISQAQLTKAGFLYVISNIGSFGENIYKVGMTRRLEPLDRVRELGDASVPFPFDVHLMVSCTDAPALENAIHRKLLRHQVNKTNPRKEFFKTDLESIIQIIREHHGDIQYVADPEALQYRQSLTMSEEDQEFIEHVFDEVEEDAGIGMDDPSLPVEA